MGMDGWVRAASRHGEKGKVIGVGNGSLVCLLVVKSIDTYDRHGESMCAI